MKVPALLVCLWGRLGLSLSFSGWTKVVALQVWRQRRRGRGRGTAARSSARPTASSKASPSLPPRPPPIGDCGPLQGDINEAISEICNIVEEAYPPARVVCERIDNMSNDVIRAVRAILHAANTAHHCAPVTDCQVPFLSFSSFLFPLFLLASCLLPPAS